jgi:hypothetical protein
MVVRSRLTLWCFASALAISTSAAATDWRAIDANVDKDFTKRSVTWIDLQSLKENEVWLYSVTPDTALTMNVRFDCAGSRYMILKLQEAADDTRTSDTGFKNDDWQSVDDGSVMEITKAYVCSGGKAVLVTEQSVPTDRLIAKSRSLMLTLKPD